jgi:hypothetical protein
MALGWLAVLKSVPWTEVVRNAPLVATGAKKLWDTVAVKKGGFQPQADMPQEPPTLEGLQAQVANLQAMMTESQRRLGDSSALVAELAEQNSQLIARIEALRKRQIWLTRGLLLTVVLAASALWLSLR